LISAGDHEITPFGGERAGDGQSNAMTGAGDEGDFAAEAVPRRLRFHS
jgi:hypothetical protein